MSNKILIISLLLTLIIIGVIACIILKQGEEVKKERPPTSSEGPNIAGIVEPEIAYAPIINVEATVVFLSPDTNQECEGRCPGYEYPKDRGTILIDRIISVDYPSSQGGLEVSISQDIRGFEVGNRVEITFRYSSRPAKVRYIPVPVINESLPPTATISRPLDRPIPKENGYFIYSIETTLVEQLTEVVLSGLEVGSKIRAKVSYEGPSRGMISIYEILQ